MQFADVSTSPITPYEFQSSVLVLNMDSLVSTLAWHVTTPPTSDVSGNRHGDPAISACSAQRQEVACVAGE
jgi:hypothetical protein